MNLSDEKKLIEKLRRDAEHLSTWSALPHDETAQLERNAADALEARHRQIERVEALRHRLLTRNTLQPRGAVIWFTEELDKALTPTDEPAKCKIHGPISARRPKRRRPFSA